MLWAFVCLIFGLSIDHNTENYCRTDGWSLLGANQMCHAHRLSKFGWKPTETKNLSLMESLREEVLVYLRETGKIPA
jgi:hypothetical protein